MEDSSAAKATLQASHEVFRLYDLPAELRNDIYSYALAHESDAVIAPVARRVLDYDNNIWIAGQWRPYFALRGRGTALELALLDERGSGWDVNKIVQTMTGQLPPYRFYGLRGAALAPLQNWYDQLAVDDHETRIFCIDKQGNTNLYKIGHLCTLECLEEPALLKVSSKIRHEAKGIFYEVNQFHIQAMEDEMKRAINWWRCIGDQSLKAICRLTLQDGHQMIEVANAGHHVNVKVETALKKVSVQNGEWRMAQRRTMSEDWATVDGPQATMCALLWTARSFHSGKACVLYIEQAIVSLGWEWATPLRTEKDAAEREAQEHCEAAAARHVKAFPFLSSLGAIETSDGSIEED